MQQLLGVRFNGTELGIVVGDGSTMLRTLDGGRSWSRVGDEIEGAFADVAFAGDDGTVVAVGGTLAPRAVIARSSDNGAIWSEITAETTSRLWGVDFIDDTVGWIVGDGGTLLRSEDGGASWQVVALPVALGRSLGSIRFLSSDIGIIAGEGGLILRTVDGGETWSRTEYVGSVDFHDICVETNGHVVATGDGGIALSTDGGRTWRDVFGGPGQGVDCADGRCIAVGLSGLVLVSSDHGATWTRSSSGTASETLYTISFADSLYGIAGGAYGSFLETKDGGRTWTRPLASQIASDFVDISCVEPGYCVAVDKDGAIVHIEDGALRIRRSVISDREPTAVEFVDTAHGIAVNAGGSIYLTSDGGRTWRDTLIARGALWDVAMPDREIIITVGSKGTVMRSLDHGTTWERLSIETDETLLHVRFFDEDNGIVASRWELFNTSDGGRTWLPRNGPTLPMYGFDFVDANNGWASGDLGRTAYTTDGGQTWTNVRHNLAMLNPGIYAHSLDFVDQRHGWIVGSGGSILTYRPDTQTSDVGSTTPADSDSSVGCWFDRTMNSVIVRIGPSKGGRGVKVELMDGLGRYVDGARWNQSTDEVQEITMEVSGALSSGMYVIVISFTGGRTSAYPIMIDK